MDSIIRFEINILTMLINLITSNICMEMFMGAFS